MFRKLLCWLTSSVSMASLVACAPSPPVPLAGSGTGVAQAGFVSIGGIEQWLQIRGDDRSHPVLLIVHGGPGEAQWPLASRYARWERHFVVVQWDQRGAGRTFGRNGPDTPDVTLDRIAADGIEVAEHLSRVLGKTRIIVLGHSWGSIVAVHMVQRRPELFAAYLGTGQVAGWKASIASQFKLLVERARRQGDGEALKALEASGPPDPSDAGAYFRFAQGLGAVMPAADQQWLATLRASSASSLGITPQEFDDLVGGMTFSGSRVLPDQMSADLMATATDLRVPFFVIQGRGDVTTPTEAAVAYFAAVRAPTKRLVLIDDAGHFALLTHGADFLRHLIDVVRPVALAYGA